VIYWLLQIIEVGDEVLTHKGRIKPVTSLYQQKVKASSLYSIDYVSAQEPLRLTGEHPIFIATKESVECKYKGQKRPCKLDKEQAQCFYSKFLPWKCAGKKKPCGRNKESYEYEMKFVPINELKVGDYVVKPIRDEEVDNNYFSEDICRLFGLYIGDGYIGWKWERKTKTKVNPIFVEFCFSNKEKGLYEEVKKIAAKIFPDSKLIIKEVPERSGMYIKIQNEDLAKLFLKHAGEGAWNKSLSEEIMILPKKKQEIIVSGMMDSDGCFYKKTNQLSYTTASKTLFNQLHMLLLRLRVENFQSIVSRRPSGFKKGNELYDQYMIQISAGSSWKVKCNKNQNYNIKPKLSSQLCMFYKNYYMCKIKSIKEMLVNSTVYNFSVEEDESYCVDNLATHNCLANLTTCSKCGKVMRNDWEACNHIRYEIGQEYRTDYGYMSRVAELCLAPKTLIKMFNGKYLPIELISKGDMVLTHKGNVKEVVETFERHYEGDLLEIEVEGVKEKIQITPNHPMYGVKSGNRNNILSIKNDFEFINAENLVVGDRLTYPVGGETLIQPNISKDKAWLLGLFAAEGSFIKKNGKKTGVVFTLNWQDEMPLAEKISKLLEKEFKPQSMVSKKGLKKEIIAKKMNNTCNSKSDDIWNLLNKNGEMTSEEVSLELSISHRSSGRLLKSLLNQNRVEKRKLKENEKLEIKGRKRSNCCVWKANGNISCGRFFGKYFTDINNTNINIICPGCGANKNDIRNIQNKNKLRCRICKTIFDKSSYIKPIIKLVEQKNGYKKLFVSYSNKEAAKWLFDMVGEYSWEKEFYEDVIRWPTDLQKEIIKGWMIGDGTKSNGGFIASTTSFNMYSQLHTMASRCGFWVRSFAMYGSKSTTFAKCVGGESVNVGGRLCRPIYNLGIYKKDAISLGLVDKKDFPKKEGVNHYSQNIPTYRIKSIKRINYSGSVHNIAVLDDNSYVTICGSVHNCGFAGDPDSCRFIEASWVEAPAFKGAVVNHYVSVPTIKDFVETNVIDFDKATKAIRSISAGDIKTLKRVRVADHKSMTAIKLFIEELQRAGRYHRVRKIAEDLIN